MIVFLTSGPASACYTGGFVKNRTIPIIVDFCNKLVLTDDFRVANIHLIYGSLVVS